MERKYRKGKEKKKNVNHSVRWTVLSNQYARGGGETRRKTKQPDPNNLQITRTVGKGNLEEEINGTPRGRE